MCTNLIHAKVPYQINENQVQLPTTKEKTISCSNLIQKEAHSNSIAMVIAVPVSNTQYIGTLTGAD